MTAEGLVESEEDERRLLVEAAVRLRRGLSLPHLNEEALHHRVLDEVRSSMNLQEPLNRPHGSPEVICELLRLRELMQVHELGIGERLVQVAELLALQVLDRDDVRGVHVTRLANVRPDRLP